MVVPTDYSVVSQETELILEGEAETGHHSSETLKRKLSVKLNTSPGH